MHTIRNFHDWLLFIMCLDRGARAGAARLLHLPLQRASQPGTVAHLAQHGDRGDLDGAAGDDPGRRSPIPSFRLLYAEDVIPKADLTIKAIGHQWYWSYEYPDNGGFSFDSDMVPDDRAQAAGSSRLLDVDNHVVVPVDTTMRVITTSLDVIHSWAMPAFGVKIDAVPGRLNETWFKIERPGMFYGQCSELCGVNHGFMPIQVEAVSKEQFAQWVEDAKKKFASTVPFGR